MERGSRSVQADKVTRRRALKCTVLAKLVLDSAILCCDRLVRLVGGQTLSLQRSCRSTSAALVQVNPCNACGS